MFQLEVLNSCFTFTCQYYRIWSAYKWTTWLWDWKSIQNSRPVYKSLRLRHTVSSHSVVEHYRRDM